MYITFSLSSNKWIDGHLGHFCVLVIVKDAAWSAYIFSRLWSQFFWIYAQEWDCWVLDDSAFNLLFSVVAAKAQKSSHLSALLITLVSFLITFILTCIRWYLLRGLVHTLLIISNAEQSFRNLFAIGMTFGEMSLQVLQPVFKLGYLFLLFSGRFSLYILNIRFLCESAFVAVTKYLVKST